MPLPFQRRLTKMYTDTKSSYDFVKEPVKNAQDPELLSLHRKLRIQKDRLVSWGLEWSDPSQSPDIDESISKAGLSELVGSVMSTIKEILAEAEPLWQSSKRMAADEKSPDLSLDRKAPIIVWDKSRFEDLMRDLTMSIDTLYDLSKTRQSARKGSMRPESSSSLSHQKGSEERLFESTRMSTPQQIDPASLIWPPGDLKYTTQGYSQPAKSSRHIVFMRRPTPPVADARRVAGPGPPVPILLEHAPYDPIYSVTGITPSMTRFEKLFAGLSQAYISSDRPVATLLPLIGYYEEAEHSRFCLLFALPTHFGPMDIENPSLRMPSISRLSDLLFSPVFEPSLEVKYRLAYNISNAVFDLHSKGVVHGNLASSNVIFLEYQQASRQPLDLTRVNMRQSYLTSYDLFSDNATDNSEPRSDTLHRHTLDPRITRYTNFTAESKSLDLYSLAILLLEIGLWSSLSEVFPARTVPENPTSVFKQLAARCGSLYVKAVKACWSAPEDELSQRARPDVMLQKVVWKVSKALDACCAIDEASDDDNGSEDSPPMPSSPVRASAPSTALKRFRRDVKPPELPSRLSEESMIWPTEKPLSVKPRSSEKTQAYEMPASSGMCPIPHSNFLSHISPVELVKPKPKLRTYPSIRISQEHLNFWHTGLMPHINHVLRGFYKKYPESVEISLESVGESSSKTKPTILVICTSVNKVRSILKKSLVYDKATYGLKVCRGKVVRSRKSGVKRSMASEIGEIEPKNVGHQQCPLNGASIGAYVNEHHLPPVSFGGLIMVDDKPYGMTVHHMLDDPSDNEEEDAPIHTRPDSPILRSSARGFAMPNLTPLDTHAEQAYFSGGEEGDEDEEYNYALSDYDSLSSTSSAASLSEFSDTDSLSDFSPFEPGDIPGIAHSSNGFEYIITQPAIDDVPIDFYPSPDTRDEDHLDSCTLGEIHASSGIRRRTDSGIVHEIDWALFSFDSSREPSRNYISEGAKYCSVPGPYPTVIVPLSEMGDLAVHCMARSSGLQEGRIMPAMCILKIYGRKTPSSSFQVAGKIGIPGDSGAWVVGNEGGGLAGQVLAWSERKRVGYLCPMSVVVKDMAETLGARTISLPGGREPIYSTVPESSQQISLATSTSRDSLQGQTYPEEIQDEGYEHDDYLSDYSFKNDGYEDVEGQHEEENFPTLIESGELNPKPPFTDFTTELRSQFGSQGRGTVRTGAEGLERVVGGLGGLGLSEGVYSQG